MNEVITLKVRHAHLFLLRHATRCLMEICVVLNAQDKMFHHLGDKNKPLVVPSLPHFVTTSGMIYNVYFSAGPSSQSENTNLAMASSACRHSLRGFADFDADNMPMDWPKQKVFTLI